MMAPELASTSSVLLTAPLLARRFDVLCVVKDVVDPVADARLAEFVVSSHMRAHPAVAERRAERAAAAEAAGEPMQVCRVLRWLLGLGVLLEARCRRFTCCW